MHISNQIYVLYIKMYTSKVWHERLTIKYVELMWCNLNGWMKKDEKKCDRLKQKAFFIIASLSWTAQNELNLMCICSHLHQDDWLHFSYPSPYVNSRFVVRPVQKQTNTLILLWHDNFISPSCIVFSLNRARTRKWQVQNGLPFAVNLLFFT